MKGVKLGNIEKSIVSDRKFLATIISYSVILVIFINLISFQSPIIGLVGSAVFFLMDTVFLGNAFFEKETPFFRLLFGVLLLIMLLGFVGWFIMIIYNLDALMFTLVLIITTTVSSVLNQRAKYKHVT